MIIIQLPAQIFHQMAPPGSLNLSQWWCKIFQSGNTDLTPLLEAMVLSMKGLCPWAVIYNSFLPSQHKFSHMLLSEQLVSISSLAQRFTGFIITMLSNTIWRIPQWFPGQPILCNCFQGFSLSATTTHLLHGPGQGPQRGHINNVSLAENHLLTALTVPINLQFSNSFRVALSVYYFNKVNFSSWNQD